jgi:hypothetical protein
VNPVKDGIVDGVSAGYTVWEKEDGGFPDHHGPNPNPKPIVPSGKRRMET